MKKISNRELDIVLIFIAVLCILDTVVVFLFKSGINFGTVLPAIIGVFLLLHVLIKHSFLFNSKARVIIKIEKFFIYSFLLWFITFLCISTIIIAASFPDKDQKTDCILILGAGLKGDRPSLVLLERLNIGLEYTKTNPSVKVVVSGGQGFGEDITEAEAMKRYLMDHGVDEKSIIEEENSTSTIENLNFSKVKYEVTTGKTLNKIMLITSDFHMFRAKFLARRVGLKAFGISSTTPYYIYPNVFIREYFAIIKSFLFDKPV